MKPDYSLIADIAEFAAMNGQSFNGACFVAAVIGMDFIRSEICGGAR